MEKRIFILLISLATLYSCGRDSREEDVLEPQENTVQDSIPTLHGQFIFLADAAVFRGDDFVYGVEIDSTALDLARRIQPLKQEDFEMVPVKLKAKIKKNPKMEGWDEVIEIREVLEIAAAQDTTAQDLSN